MTNIRTYTEEERKAHVDGWKNSGLTQIEYSNLNGLKKTTLCTWYNKTVNQTGGEKTKNICYIFQRRKEDGKAEEDLQ